MNNNKSPNGIGSLIVGAAIGAAAVTMLHEPTRKKLKGKLMKALDESGTKLDEMKGKADSVKKDIKNRAIKELNKTQKKIADSV